MIFLCGFQDPCLLQCFGVSSGCLAFPCYTTDYACHVRSHMCSVTAFRNLAILDCTIPVQPAIANGANLKPSFRISSKQGSMALAAGGGISLRPYGPTWHPIAGDVDHFAQSPAEIHPYLHELGLRWYRWHCARKRAFEELLQDREPIQFASCTII